MRKLLPNPKDRGHFPRLLQLLALFTLFFALPQTSWAQDADYSKAIYSDEFGGVYITSDNAGNILGNGTMSYDADTNELTLKGIDLSCSGDHGSQVWNSFISCVDWSEDLNHIIVRLVGQNYLQVDDLGRFFDGAGITFVTDEANPGSLTINTPEGWNGNMFVNDSDPITPNYSNGLGLTKNGNAYTIQVPVSYNITVAGTAVTSANAANVLNDDYSSVSYDATTNTLTLKGAHLNSATGDNNISATSALTIHLEGYNTVGTINVNDGQGSVVVTATTNETLPGYLNYSNMSGNFTWNYQNGLRGRTVEGKYVISSESTNPYIIYATGYHNGTDEYWYDNGDLVCYDNKDSQVELGNTEITLENSQNNSNIQYFKVAPLPNGDQKEAYLFPIGISIYDDLNLITKAYFQFDWGTCTNKDVKVQVRGLKYEGSYPEYDGKDYSEEVSLPSNGGLVEIPLTGIVTSENVQIYFSSSTDGFSFIPISVGFLKTEGYGLTVAGVEVTADNASNITGANIQGTVSYDVENHKLTLNGVTLTSPIHWGTDEDLTIELKGTNSIRTDGSCITNEYDGMNISFTQGDTSNPCSLTLSSTGAAVAADVITGFSYTNAPSMGTGLYWIPTSNNGTITSATITNSILGGGAGTSESPFIISTFDHLKTFATYINNGILSTEFFKLGANIECPSNQTGFEPIGFKDITNNIDNTFKGTFDGDNKKIMSLSVTGVSGEHVGLFRCLDGGTITQLILDGCNISGGDTSSDYIGGIVGYVSSGTVSKCTVQNGSTISCSENSQNPTVGGIVGYLDNGEITECVFQDSYVKAETSASGVSGPAANSGGIVGKTAGGTVSKCQVKGAAEISAIYPDASTKAGAIIGMINSVTMSENTYDYSVKTTVQNTTYSGYTQRGIGGNSSGGSNYDEIGKVELATKKVEIYVEEAMGTGPYSVENTNYYILKDNIYYVSYYVSPNKEFKCSATSNSAYYKPRLTLDDGTIEVTPVEIYNSGVYNHTEFTFTMPNADVTATLSFPINLAADGITATIDDLDYTGSAIEPTTIKVTGIPGPTGVTELTKGTDFTITGYTLNNEPADPINPGEYKVTIEGMGNYTGSMVIDYKINNVYNLKINGTQVKGANIVDVFNDGKVVFTPATDTEPNTLTLSGAEIGGTIESGLENLTIQINGVNSLEYITSTNNTAPLIFKKGTVNSSLSFSNTIGKPAVAGFASVAYNETYYKSFGSSKYVAGDVREFRSKYGGAQQDLTITTDVYYPLWVRDTQVSSANKNNVLNDENATVKFDGTNTLTLNGASISSSSAIDCNLKDLVIYLNGDNTLGTYYDGIYPILSLDGTGTLTIAKDDNATGFVSLSLQTTGNTAVISGFSSVVHTGLNFISKTGTTLNGTTTYDATLSSATIYPLWVGGTLVTEKTTSGTDATSGNTIWEYNANSNTLTLTNYNNTDYDGHAFISNMANLNVYLVGTNTVGPSSQISTDKAFYTTYTDATLTFSTDENNKGTLDASGYDTFCEGFKTNEEGILTGIYCNNGLGYFPSERKIEAKKSPTISFAKADQTTGDRIYPYEYITSCETTYGTSFKAPKPTFNNGYIDLCDSTKYVYSYSENGIVKFAEDGSDYGNPGKIPYGEINLLKAGTVTITCSFPGNMQNNPCSASYTLQVNKADAQVFEYEVDGQKITAANGYIDVDGTTSKWGTPQVSGAEPTLSKPDDVTSIITYGSSDNNVATVSETGAVTPKGPGTAIISATLKDDERYNDSTATYTLIVMAPATVSFANATASILNTETYTQAATTIPEGSSITYSTNNTNGNVSVNGNGEVTISNSFCGTVTITATVTSVPDANPQCYYVLSNNPAFQASYTLTVSKIFNDVTFADGQNYATYYNGSDDMTVPEGLTAYLATGTSGNSVVTYQINYLPKNVPLLLEKSATAGSTLTNTTYSGTGLTDAEKNSNLLQHAEGNLPVANITGGTPYVLYKNEFVKATGTISGDHCYLLITNNAPTRGFYSIGDGNDGSTAIEGIELENEEVRDEWYDLQGRRIAKPTKAGLYIKNGKKMVINNK